MANTEFMDTKFKVRVAFENFLSDVTKIKSKYTLPDLDQQKLYRYQQAITVIRDASVMDIVKCAVSFGRNLSGKPEQIWKALPTMIGNRVQHPTKVDIEYAKVLLEYSIALQKHKKNIKDYMLKFILTNALSPVTPYFNHQLNQVISLNQQRIASGA
jgi:hypothetical protein